MEGDRERAAEAPVPDGEVHGWTGELDRNGKAIRDEVGAVLPRGGAGFE